MSRCAPVRVLGGFLGCRLLGPPWLDLSQAFGGIFGPEDRKKELSSAEKDEMSGSHLNMMHAYTAFVRAPHVHSRNVINRVLTIRLDQWFSGSSAPKKETQEETPGANSRATAMANLGTSPVNSFKIVGPVSFHSSRKLAPNTLPTHIHKPTPTGNARKDK